MKSIKAQKYTFIYFLSDHSHPTTPTFTSKTPPGIRHNHKTGLNADGFGSLKEVAVGVEIGA